MGMHKKNSGIYRQDGVLAKFTADARKPQQVSLVVAQALEAGKKKKSLFRRASKESET
jgi:hypothetical protein